ncbi:PAS domain-containing protein [Streptomyces venezuelae ATCC 10712]
MRSKSPESRTPLPLASKREKTSSIRWAASVRMSVTCSRTARGSGPCSMRASSQPRRGQKGDGEAVSGTGRSERTAVATARKDDGSMEGLPFTSPAGVDEGGPLGPPPAALALIAADGVLVGWSREAEALLGYTAPQVLGRPAADLLVPPAGRDRPEEPRQQLGRPEPSRPEPSRPEPPRTDSPLRLDGSRSAVVDVRHRGGHTLRVAVTLHPLAPAPDATGQAPPPSSWQPNWRVFAGGRPGRRCSRDSSPSRR